MDLLASVLVAIAVLSLGLGLAATPAKPTSRLLDRLLARSARQLAAARLATDPRLYLATTLLAPPLFFALGWLQSPVLALGAGIGGLVVPRLYLAWLTHTQSRKSEAEAGQLLQSLLAGLAAGGTYLHALREARSRCSDAWLQEDLDHVIQRFLLDAPLHESIRDVRARTTTRNLGLIWHTLAICTENQLPTERARQLLQELSATVQFNVQLANEVRARSTGHRAQIWLLAVIVPGMFLYLRLMSPDLLSVLDETVLGQFVLFPLAVALELGGIVISFRIARLRT